MLELNGNSLGIQDVVDIARDDVQVGLDQGARESIRISNQNLNKIIERNLPVYGINTGFGIFSDQTIPPAEAGRLSRNLILSHAVGMGPALRRDIVRAGMVIRANTLAKGLSGIRVDVIETLLALLNHKITPVIPSQGSLGSSGDLCQLSHMSLVFSRDEVDKDEESGWAVVDGQILTGKACLQKAGIERIVLGPKEGLALSNGAAFSAAIAALAVSDSQYLSDVADLALSLSLEAMLGCSAAFDPRIHLARGHPGQIKVAKRILDYTADSTLVDSTQRVQDAYSLRCAPQVHGAVRDTIDYCEQVVTQEINAATDNPLIFGDDQVLSGGNFHGEPIGFAMDYLSIAMCELAGISERRIFRLIDGKLNNGLPSMLVDSPEKAGLNSGLMMPHYTAASLVLENQTLATPDSIRSLPTAGEQEDHNANSMTASRHTHQIIENVLHVLSIEIFTACQALDLRLRDNPGKSPGRISGKVYEEIRKIVPYRPNDSWWGPEIEKVREWIRSGHIKPILAGIS